jgi:hypothetical protein
MAAAPVPALFSPAGPAFAAAPIARGPWDARMMHGGAPGALLAHAIERVRPGAELAVSRLTIEFLGGVPLGEVSVAASLAKPGGRFQIVDATLRAGERVVCMARAVRLRRTEMPDAAASSAEAQPLPPPAAGEPWSYFADLGGERFHPDAWSAESPAPATRSPGSACAGSCCRPWRRRRWRAPPPQRTSPTA